MCLLLILFVLLYVLLFIFFNIKKAALIRPKIKINCLELTRTNFKRYLRISFKSPDLSKNLKYFSHLKKTQKILAFLSCFNLTKKSLCDHMAMF